MPAMQGSGPLEQLKAELALANAHLQAATDLLAACADRVPSVADTQHYVMCEAIQFMIEAFDRRIVFANTENMPRDCYVGDFWAAIDDQIFPVEVDYTTGAYSLEKYEDLQDRKKLQSATHGEMPCWILVIRDTDADLVVPDTVLQAASRNGDIVRRIVRKKSSCGGYELEDSEGYLYNLFHSVSFMSGVQLGSTLREPVSSHETHALFVEPADEEDIPF